MMGDPAYLFESIKEKGSTLDWFEWLVYWLLEYAY